MFSPEVTDALNPDLSGLPDSALIARLANVLVTGAGAGGHRKGKMNDALAGAYLGEIEHRGIEPPERDALYAIGEFNGPGSL